MHASTKGHTLFAAAAAVSEEAAADPVRDAVAEIDADTLTPREALDLIYRLKALLADGS